MATDGLFDALSNQRVIEVTRRSSTPQEAAQRLVQLACAAPECGDNVSVLVVRFVWTIDVIGGRNERPSVTPRSAAASRSGSTGGRDNKTAGRVTDEELLRAARFPSIRKLLPEISGRCVVAVARARRSSNGTRVAHRGR